MMRKKILFLITKATWGGAQRYVYDLATNVPQADFEPIVAFGQSGRLTSMLAEKGIGAHQIPALGRDIAIVSDISSFFQILICLWREKPDVVHLNSSKAAALGAIAARIAGVPKIIFTVHGWPFNEQRGAIVRAFIYYVSMFTVLLSHAVIVVSKSDEVPVRHMKKMREKIHYIPIGIQPPELLPRDEASAFFSLSTTAPRIGTIAELTPNKGLRYAIEAVAILKEQRVDVSYCIIGDGEGRERLQALAREFEVADRVSFAGFIPDASKYLRAFDVFLLPSIKEGMPYVLLEAAAAGLPIVTTNIVNPEFVEHTKSVRAVVSADPQAIAEAIIKTIGEKSEGQLLLAQNHFPLSEMIPKTTALYR